MSLAAQIKQKARDLGFDLAGIAPATPADGFERLQDWLARGYAGEMDYMQRHGAAHRQPTSILPNVRSVLMVALNYKPAAEDLEKLQTARIARYALGTDYHDVLRSKMKQLLHWIEARFPGNSGRAVVDTAPLLERDYARRAGLGWFGKNTMLIHPKLGSYFFLGALLLDFEIPADAPFTTSHCGTCTACLDACPTQAFVGPGMLDSRRCISYLTIELRGSIAPELRRGMGDWLFGCDVCQEVCPWNRKAPRATEPAFHPRPELMAVDPVALLSLSEAEFRSWFKDTALWRTKRGGLVRNAAIVLGNTGDATTLPALHRALNDPDPGVRETVQWAIAEIHHRNPELAVPTPPLDCDQAPIC